MDIRLSVGLTEVIKDDVVVKYVENTGDDFKNNMYEMCEGNELMLEALRFCHRKLKIVSTTFKDVK